MLRQRNYTIRAAAAQGLSYVVISTRKSVVAAVPRSTWRSLVKRGQSKITCFAVSHCHPQLQAGDSRPGTRGLWGSSTVL